MDRIRESRRAGALSNIHNGVSRRRHRTSTFRDSPDDEAEPARLRERGGKKERERDRERDRDRERSRSSKRRRADRLMNAGDESSEEEEEEEGSVNDDEEDDDDVDVNFSRMLPPLPTNYNNYNNNSVHSHSQNLNRKSLLPESGKVFKAAAWKASSHVVAGDEMIGVSVPRKARTASTKRSHDWIGGGGGGGEQVNHRQASSSTSPVRGGGGGIVMSKQGVRDSAPLSPPSSSNVSIKKKIRPCGGLKPRPQPRSATTSKSSSSNNNPEELEIEIAEVLYGLMTQSQAPLKNDSSKNEFNSNKSSSEAKSRAPSPVSNSSSAAPITAVAPKRKKARQLVDNNLVASSSTWSSPTTKVEIDQTRRSEVCPPNLERNFGSAAENGESANSGKSGAEANQHLPKSMKLEGSTLTESKGDLMEEAGESRDAVSTTKEVVNSIKKDSAVVKLKDDPKAMITTSMVTSTNVITEAPANENKREEDFQIDLMAPPPQLRSSPERDRAVSFISDRDRTVFDMEKMGEMSKVKETGKVGTSKEDTVIQSDEKGARTVIEEVEFQKSLTSKERNIDLHFGLEKSGMDTVNNPQNGHLVQSQGQYSKSKPAFKEEQLSTDRSAQSISLPLPMSVASWPGGIPPPIGYMAPLQGVVSVEGGTMPPAPFQPLLSQPRPKRCATHCHIARNIHYYQQLMKMNPFWPAPSGTASMFGAKPANVNVMNPTELHGNSSGRSLNSMQDKGHSLAIFPSNAVKEKFAQPASIADAGHGKQQILLQHALPPVPPNNMMHGPAFIFPFNQQQAAVVATSGRPASAKSPTTTGSLPCTGATNLTTVTASASAPANASALGFNYPNMPANETQYLVLQNSPYPFPIPAVGAPQNFRGHAQPMPMFNGSFYPSQMIHPLQLQQQQAPTSQQQQIQKTHQNTSSGPASSQKHLQSQQHRPQGIAINGGGTENGVLQNFAAPKSRSSQHPQQNQNQHIPPSQARQLESEVGGENSPSTPDSRGSRAPVNIYNHNFAMPIHSQNFALMSSSAASAGATGAGAGNQNDKKQTHHQHPGFKSGAESLPSQAFAMSFGPMIGSTSACGIDLSSMSQNHAILQSLPEATRQSYHQVMQAAATAQAVQQKKNSRLSEDGKIVGAVSINADEERKVITGKGPASSGGQSISFSRPDFADASESATPNDSATNSIARMLNLAPGSTHMPNGMNLGGSSNSHLHAQLQHQQLIQMHNQQQHQQQQLAANVTARSKTPTSNGISSSEHLTSASASVAGKFPNSISGFPPNFIQSNNSSSPTQSSQWKNSNRTSTSQVQSSLVSSTASPKNHQQQQSRTLQNHTQISFGTNQKSSASQGQQQPNSSQSPSPPVAVGSPTHSSLSKGTSSSPRTNTAPTNKTGQASTLSSQQPKNSTSVPSQKSSPAGGRNVPSVLGNPHSASQSATTKTQIQTQQLQQQQRHQQQFQQQLSKQTLQQALFFSNPYFQGQPLKSAGSNTSAASGYNIQRRHSEQPQGSSPSSGMLSMCPPATLSNTSTTDPAKAAAAAAAVAAAASNMKGGGFSSQGILHSAQFGVQSGNSYQPLPVGFSYGHSVPAVVQVKPAEQKQPPEQKQPAA